MRARYLPPWLVAVALTGCDGTAPFFVETLLVGDTGDGVGPYSIVTVVTDDQEVASVTLRYRLELAGEPRQVALIPMEARDTWLGAISGPRSRGRIYYYLEATDAAGNLARDPALAPDMYSFAVAPHQPRPPTAPERPAADAGPLPDRGSADTGLDVTAPAPDVVVPDVVVPDVVVPDVVVPDVVVPDVVVPDVVVPDPCLPDPCVGHERCDGRTGVAVCTCPDDYTGSACDRCATGAHDGGGGTCVLHRFAWTIGFDGAGSAYPTALAVDLEDHIVVAGKYNRWVDLGGGPLPEEQDGDSPNLFLARFTPDGDHLWSRGLVSRNSTLSLWPEISSVATDRAGNIVITGDFNNQLDLGGDLLVGQPTGTDIFFAKYTAAGEHLWSKSFGGPPRHYAHALAVDDSDRIVMTGMFGDFLDLGGGPMTTAQSAAYVAMFDPAGDHLWSTHFGSADGFSRGEAITIDRNGGVVVAGVFGDSLDLGGDRFTSAGLQDIFIVQLDPLGAHLWSASFGSDLGETANAVAMDPEGNVSIAGTYRGPLDLGGGPLTGHGPGSDDAYVVRFDASWQHLFSRGYSDSGGIDTETVAVDRSGNTYVAGTFSGGLNLGGSNLYATIWDGYVGMLGPDGAHVWSTRYGEASSQRADLVAIGEDGGLVVTGSYVEAIVLGPERIETQGDRGTYLAKYRPWCSAGFHPVGASCVAD